MGTAGTIEELERRLSDFDAAQRRAALEDLAARCARGEVELPEPGGNANLHIHSFFSYNADGHSPARIAWESRRAGLLVGGIVDFDVLDGLEEFLAAGDLLGLRSTVGVESRVFVRDYAEKEINSPGEPGISYQMGLGFSRPPDPGSRAARVLDRMRGLARRRNEQMAARVNDYLGEAAVDYERDVLPLSPSGNATERHMLAAYAAKGEAVFPETGARAAYWAAKLGEPPERIGRLLVDGPAFGELMRARLMKKGGVGYAPPEKESFPTLEEMIEMAAGCGAMPCATWLDGLSAGEADPNEVVAFHASKGALAINVIPDRNWRVAEPELNRRKTANLYAIVEAARAANLVIIHGTERNKPGLPFLDDLACEALAPIAEPLRAGALAAYGHTAMARCADRPIGGEWSRMTFGSDAAARNRFYAAVGSALEPGPRSADRLRRACERREPGAILEALEGGDT